MGFKNSYTGRVFISSCLMTMQWICETEQFLKLCLIWFKYTQICYYQVSTNHAKSGNPKPSFVIHSHDSNLKGSSMNCIISIHFYAPLLLHYGVGISRLLSEPMSEHAIHSLGPRLTIDCKVHNMYYSVTSIWHHLEYMDFHCRETSEASTIALGTWVPQRIIQTRR
jgi:hypothetical protein